MRFLNKLGMSSNAVFIVGLIFGGIIGGLAVFVIMDDSEEISENPVSVYEIPNKKLVLSSYLFDIIVPESGFYRILENPEYLKYMSTDIVPREEHRALYSQIGLFSEPQNVVVVFPKFTEAAYSQPGFYNYFRGECDEQCLTVTIGDYPPHYTASKNGFKVLRALGYDSIDDVTLAKNPEILESFDKVIMLHNEYVTREMFDAVTNHPNVVYLYPNALFAEVEYDEENNSITLIRGHAYPTPEIDNGFDWEYDNTRPAEYDTDCKEWEFIEIPNGRMLNCYPEIFILKSDSLLRMLKEF